LPAWGETVQEPGAPVQLDEHRRERRERQQPGELFHESGRSGRDVLCGQRWDDQVTVLVEPHRSLTVREHAIQPSTVTEHIRPTNRCTMS
jgi:hypothetical protein